MKSRLLKKAAAAVGAGIVLLAAATFYYAAPLPSSLEQMTADARKTQFLDRHGEPLNVSFRNYWNVHDRLPLYRIPDLMQKMFIAAEDRNFYSHAGTDWLARLNALRQNVRAGGIVRGASTLSEQVVRMIYPRPRTFFSKWLEGWDAFRLERRFSKADILEFYLNQVPYASNRRGIVQASRYYFSKTPDRLTAREMAALTVLVRAPSSFDPYRYPGKTDRLVDRALKKFHEGGLLSAEEYRRAAEGRLRLSPPSLTASAEHFLDYVRETEPLDGRPVVTTLDAYLQDKIKRMTRSRLKELRHRNVGNAAVLVLDRRTGDVLAWVSESSDRERDGAFDAVRVLRQPASAQKPFLYALALTKGWRAWTLITDEPYARAVGRGVHHFHNYSNLYYGDVTLREALGNSLNIPALKTIEFVGIASYLDFLKKAGFSHFDREASFYREGLALGNAEVSLLELSRAYLMLANMGTAKPVRTRTDRPGKPDGERLLPETAASLIADILSDPLARQLEFGRDSILNFPVQTAVKTGTSTDYRDAWAMGYNADFVAGVWMGNLSYDPMKEVTGSVGPALLLRAVFGELNRRKETGPLFLSPDLKRRSMGNASELYDPSIPEVRPDGERALLMLRPAHGIALAVDPRVPRANQEYRFELNFLPEGAEAVWTVDGKEAGRSKEPFFFWRLERGAHTASAEAVFPDGRRLSAGEHEFNVY